MSISSEDQRRAESAQQTAARDGNSRIRLVAGPGTGKSFAIEERVSWLLSNGSSPDSIFVVSFTRAAANELAGRIESHCKRKGLENAKDISVTTLHSLTLRILKKPWREKNYAGKYGLSPRCCPSERRSTMARTTA
ncbi:UvrD-helicase domain-containing protein, partial [Corallococcus sp. AS-1-12]|uniref:UvrD-helicase domain-containing protein n=1 Tax=Corallococcus sp. AS-1-12 TaxID=2874598 RepID=UPI001CBBE379|nr:UvrD-helicase domain-containing protein [Corallococcus sp. AS-1-12]